MTLTQLTIGGRCGSCGETFDASGDDFAVDVVWREFRGLHDKCKSATESELVERIIERLREIAPAWKNADGETALINVIGHIRHRFGTVDVLPDPLYLDPPTPEPHYHEYGEWKPNTGSSPRQWRRCECGSFNYRNRPQECHHPEWYWTSDHERKCSACPAYLEEHEGHLHEYAADGLCYVTAACKASKWDNA